MGRTATCRLKIRDRRIRGENCAAKAHRYRKKGKGHRDWTASGLRFGAKGVVKNCVAKHTAAVNAWRMRMRMRMRQRRGTQTRHDRAWEKSSSAKRKAIRCRAQSVQKD